MISYRKISMDIDIYFILKLLGAKESVAIFICLWARSRSAQFTQGRKEQRRSFVQLLSLTVLADWIHLQHFHPNNRQLV